LFDLPRVTLQTHCPPRQAKTTMWDGSFRAKKREVSMRGKSTRQTANELKEKARLERENRAKHRRENFLATRIQAWARSFLAREQYKELLEQECQQVLSRLERSFSQHDYSEATTQHAVLLTTLCNQLRRVLGSPSVQLVAQLCEVVTTLIKQKMTYKSLLFGERMQSGSCEFNAPGFIKGVLEAITKVLSGKKLDTDIDSSELVQVTCTCLLTILTPSMWATEGGNVDAQAKVANEQQAKRFVESLGSSNVRAALSALEVLFVNAAPSSLEAEVLILICSELSSAASKGALTDGNMELFSEVLLYPPFETLRTFGVISLIKHEYPTELWYKCANSIAASGSLSPSTMSNIIAITFELRKSRDDQNLLLVVLYETLAAFFSKKANSLEIEKNPSFQKFRDPAFVQSELYAALASSTDASVAVVKTFEVIRTQCTEAVAQFDTRSIKLNALSSLSASSVITNAVAFSPKEKSIVRFLWEILLGHFDSSSRKIKPTLFSIGSRDSVMALLAFTFSCTIALVGALDDRELFTDGLRFDQRELHDMVGFLHDILYVALWDQGTASNGSVTPTREGIPILDSTTTYQAVAVYDHLYTRYSRHRMLDDESWLFPPIPSVELGIQNMNSRGIPRFRLGVAMHRDGRGRVMNSVESEDNRAREGENGESDLDSDNEDTDSEDVVMAEAEHASGRVKNILRLLPQVVRFEDRVKIFDYALDLDHSAHASTTGWHSHGRLQLAVVRGSEYDDAFEAWADLRNGELKVLRTQISFINAQGLNEAGVDGGGVFKEFLIEFCKQAFDPSQGLWQATSDGALFPNPNSGAASADHLRHFEFQGRMMGKAVYEGILLDLNFAHFFLNLLLGNRNHLHDLQSLDPELYRNLLLLKEMPAIEDLGLTFSATRSVGQQEVDVDLIPDGAITPVTRDNYLHYIRRLSSYRLNEAFAEQARAFFHGFADMVQSSWIKMFKPLELQLVIGGSDKPFDIEELKQHCSYSGGYAASQPYIKAFWEIVEEFDDETRANLLKFVTSCPKPPLQGFGALNPKFCVSQVRINSDSDRLATSSTCVNLLKLPKYSSKEVLREKLLYSINSSSGFELS